MHAVWTGLAVLALAFVAIRGAEKAGRPRSDFAIYHAAGRAVLDGRDPQAVEGFLYLPAFALVVAPLAALELPFAAVLWTALSLAAFVLALRLTIGLVAPGRAPPWLTWALLLTTLRLVDSNLAYGQVNLITLALVVAGYAALERGHERRAGAWLGVAAALKVLPAFFLVHLALTRRWRALAVGLAVGLVLAIGLPVVVQGSDVALDGLLRWFESEVRPYLHGGPALLERRDYVPGHSLTAALYRSLAAIPATSKGLAGPTANVVAHDLATVAWLVRAANLVVLAAFAWSVLRGRSRDAHERARGFALAVATALVTAPLVHKAHLVWLVVPWAWLAVELARRPSRSRTGLALVSVALVALSVPPLLGGFARTVATHNALFGGLLGTWVALVASGGHAHFGGAGRYVEQPADATGTND